MIRTVGQLIDAIGGTFQAAEAFGVSRTVLSNWRVANDLPLHARHRAIEIAIANSLLIEPKLVGPKKRAPYGSRKRKARKAKRTAYLAAAE